MCKIPTIDLLHVNEDPSRTDEDFYNTFENDSMVAHLRLANATGGGLCPSLIDLYNLLDYENKNPEKPNPSFKKPISDVDSTHVDESVTPSTDSTSVEELAYYKVEKEKKVKELVENVVSDFNKITSEVLRAQDIGKKKFSEERDPTKKILSCAGCGYKEFQITGGPNQFPNFFQKNIADIANVFAFDNIRDAEKIGRLLRASHYSIQNINASYTLDKVFSYYEDPTTKQRYHFIRRFVSDKQTVYLCADCHEFCKHPTFTEETKKKKKCYYSSTAFCCCCRLGKSFQY